MIACKNCGSHFKGNYCYQCGQPAETHVINFHFLWHDIQHGLLHLDKGISYTIKELFTRPGKSIREYLEGKRVKHFKPISLVLVLAGIYGLLFHLLHIDFVADSMSITVTGSGSDADHQRELLNEIIEWISAHYAIVSLFQVPFYALGSFLAFKKTGYNFTEHIVINAFLAGQRLALRIFMSPVSYLLRETPAFKQFSGMLTFLSFFLNLWAFFQLFPSLGKASIFFRTVFAFGILFIGMVALGFILFGPKDLHS